ncbi:MAG: T9SS type A sorting domain-containing protein, partial [Cryomorphaceae bacterium]
VSVSTSADVCNPESTISVDIGSLSTTERDDLDFLIYPNPSNGDFVVESPNGIALAEVVLYDAVGRRVEVIQKTVKRTQVELSIPDPVAGMYIILLTSSDGVVQRSRVIFN